MNVLDAMEAAPPPKRRQFAAWVAREPALVGLRPDELRDVLLDDTEPVDYERRDELLAALIRLARTEKEAQSLLIVCLLPGFRRKISQHGWGLDHEEAIGIALEALCRRIWNYPLLRRPHRIASNLLMDTAHDLIDARTKERDWQANTQLTVTTPDRALLEPDETPELVWEAARRAGVLNDREVAILRSTRIHDLPIDQVAPLIGMSHDAARKARQRAVHKLRAWWDPDRGVA